jgi:hypothetical protein
MYRATKVVIKGMRERSNGSFLEVPPPPAFFVSCVEETPNSQPDSAAPF